MKKLVTSAATALGLALAATAPAQAQSPDEPRCDVEFQPSQVVVQQKTVTVAAALSEQVKQVTEIAPQGESGLVVEAFQQQEPSARQPDVVIRLDTSDANAGEWSVTVAGEATTCEGTLTVRRPQDDPGS